MMVVASVKYVMLVMDIEAAKVEFVKKMEYVSNMNNKPFLVIISKKVLNMFVRNVKNIISL